MWTPRGPDIGWVTRKRHTSAGNTRSFSASFLFETSSGCEGRRSCWPTRVCGAVDDDSTVSAGASAVPPRPRSDAFRRLTVGKEAQMKFKRWDATLLGVVAMALGLACESSAPVAAPSTSRADALSASVGAPTAAAQIGWQIFSSASATAADGLKRSEEHTSELQSLAYLVCRLLLEKKKD